MEKQVKWHAEVLDADGHSAAARLTPLLHDGFYLAGGTALALRHGHRISLDLDCFSKTEKLGETGRIALTERLKSSGKLKVLKSSEGTLHLLLATTAVSLFHYPYPLCGKTEHWEGLPVASDLDIGAMKLSAIIGRGSRKDFLDLYWICRATGLTPVLDAAAAKFRDHQDFLLQAARALVYFDDAEEEPMPRLLRRVSWREVKSFFASQTPKLLRKRIR